MLHKCRFGIKIMLKRTIHHFGTVRTGWIFSKGDQLVPPDNWSDFYRGWKSNFHFSVQFSKNARKTLI